jgi:hypothetical protein
MRWTAIVNAKHTTFYILIMCLCSITAKRQSQDEQLTVITLQPLQRSTNVFPHSSKCLVSSTSNSVCHSTLYPGGYPGTAGKLDSLNHYERMLQCSLWTFFSQGMFRATVDIKLLLGKILALSHVSLPHTCVLKGCRPFIRVRILARYASAELVWYTSMKHFWHLP